MTSESARHETLPCALTGTFRPWRYSVSHSELEIRGVAAGGAVTRVLFFGVLGVQLKSVYSSLTLSSAGEVQRRRILTSSGVDPQTGRVHAVLLSADPEEGFVACLSFVVRTHHGGGPVDRWGIPNGDSELMVRS
ncbi:hypothetical protein AB0C50_26975 [Micromonospora taraxaci]|uniref:hypothetical protein n=1 Tax=Micromonospora taraxaci TaxID=1316803 RepID=UPI0033C32EEA